MAAEQAHERSRRVPEHSSATSLAQWGVVSSAEDEHPARLAALALRSRSPQVLDALIECAGAGPAGRAALGGLARGGVPASMLSPRTGPYTVALTTALAGRHPGSPDGDLALTLTDALVERGERAWWWQRAASVAVQNAIVCGAPDRATAWLEALPRVPLAVRWAIWADAANPYLPDRSGQRRAIVDVASTEHAAWEKKLSAPFERTELAPLEIDARASTLFDGLRARSVPGSQDGPLVTVVMPTYAPDEGLLTSVRSLLAQSYGNLEILLMDDHSDEGYSGVYEQAASLDARITLVRMEVNGGSYLARNAAMARARGTYVTFQDGDDWSHPERIARQVAALRNAPEAPASLSRAIRATDDLGYTWLGFSPQRDNASSLMLTRPTLDRLGPFQRVRKGADSEYAKRIEAVVGEPLRVGEALAVTRLRAGSLSRADFQLEWHVPDRVSYRNVFGHWHRTRAVEETPLAVGPGDPQPFPPPRSFRIRHGDEPAPQEDFDLGYLLDASVPGPLPGTAAGLPTGTAGGPAAVIHREDVGLARPRWEPFRTDLLELVQTGALTLVSTTDHVRMSTLVVLTPGALEFADETGVAAEAGRVLVSVPLPDATDRVVDLLQVADTCREIFGTRPTWVALDAAAQQAWSTDGWHLPLLEETLRTSQ